MTGKDEGGAKRLRGRARPTIEDVAWAIANTGRQWRPNELKDAKPYGTPDSLRYCEMCTRYNPEEQRCGVLGGDLEAEGFQKIRACKEAGYRDLPRVEVLRKAGRRR